MSKYKFNDKEHIHEILRDGETIWQPLFGTTSVINEVYPPPLAWYGSAKALEPFGFISDKKEPDEYKRRELAEEAGRKIMDMFESDLWLDEYVTFLDKAYKNHDSYKKSKGKAGKDMHSKIEMYIKWCLMNHGGCPITLIEGRTTLNELIEGVEGFVEWASKDVKTFLWSEAHCYSEKLWCGGITDFGFVHSGGKTIIGDAKPAVYPKQFIQTAAYGLQIRENGTMDAEGNTVLAPISVDGYMIFDYNKGETRYLSGEWVPKLESNFIHTLEVYKMKDLTGTKTL